MLSSVSILALAGLLGVAGIAPALADPPAEDQVAIVAPNVDGFFSDTATGFIAAALHQINVGNVTAAITLGTADLVANTVTTGVNVGTSNTVSTNAFEAVATGNSQVNSVALAAIGPGGIAVLATQINASPLAGQGAGSAVPPTITSGVTASTISASLFDFTTGSAVVNGNTIAAQTTGSTNATTVSGQVPNGFASIATASNVYNGSSATPSTVEGTVAVSTVQDNLNVGQNYGSTATIGGAGGLADSITLLIEPQVGLTAQATTGGQVNSNSLSAQYVGNASNNTISILAGLNPTFNGSLALSNISANYSTIAPTTPLLAAATNTGSTVSASILDHLDAGTPVSDTLTGSLTVSANTISASATGNQALPPSGSSLAAGNLITIAGGENFAGTGSGEVNTITFVGANTTAATNADILLFNSQANAAIGLGSSAVTSDTEGGSINALVDNLVGGSVNLATNAIASNATGNAASNAILGSVAMPSTTTLIAGTAALGSVQLDQLSPVTALLGTTTGNSITATVGQIAGGSNVTTALVSDASVTLTSNSLKAQAYGNDVSNTLSLAATTVDPGLTPIGPTTLTVQHTNAGGSSTSSAVADATINNVQRTSDGSAVTATNENSLIAITAASTSAITNSSFTNTLGSIQGVAIGNSANNALSLNATNLFSTGGIANLQSIGGPVGDTTNQVSAAVVNPQVAIYAGNAGGAITADVGLLDDSLYVTLNLLQAFAAGNQATNGLSATGTVVTVPSPNSVASSSLTYNFLNAAGLYFDGTTAASLHGAYDILSSQATNSPVSASVTGTAAPFLIQIGTSGAPPTPGTVNGDGAYVDNNTIFATAIGNEIAPGGGNTLNLNANSLPQPQNATPAPIYAPLAGITNIQELGSGASATAGIQTGGTPGSPLYEVNVGGNVGENANDTVGTGATITISNNLTQALAEGNFANNNTLNVTGNSINDGVTAIAPTSLTGLTIGGLGLPPSGSSTITAELALTVVNVQSVALGDGVTANVQTVAGTSTGGYGALINVGGNYVVGSTLTEANNVFLATAIDNNALLNTINITGLTNLAVSAGVQNVQYSAADASATLGTPGTLGTPPTPGLPADNFTGGLTFTVVGTPSAAGGNVTFTGSNYIEIPITGLDARQLAVLESTFGGASDTSTHPGYLTVTSGTFNISTIEGVDPGLSLTTLSNNLTAGSQTNITVPATAGSPGTAPVPSALAQIIAVNDPITNSALSITSAKGTTPSGATAISNNAVNTLSLSADIITGSSGIASPNATVNGGPNTLVAAADYAVQNAQVVVGTGPSATAYETLGITNFTTGTPTPYGITGSSLTITGNGLQAVSEGNVANNTLSLSLTDTGTPAPSGALLSAQYGDITGTQLALSGLMAYAPAAIGGLTSGTGSSVTISNNTNNALSVQNDATNTVSVTGTNVGGVLTVIGGPLPALASYNGGVGSTIAAQGTYTLNNTQYATGGGVSSVANTAIFNYDNLLATTSGIVNSSATFDNNVTTAESDANRANVGGGNSLTLTATNLSASAALTNFQDTAMTVYALATSSTGIALNGGASNTPAPAAVSSTLDVSGNMTTATARGNIAINSLVTDGSATNGTGPATPQASATVDLIAPLTASAGSNGATNNALLNVQINGGPVTSIGTGIEYISLAGVGSAGAIGSTVTLDNNMVTAEADGNVGGSTLTLLGTNLYSNGALTSVQTNSGAINAAATGSVTASITGGATGIAGTSGSTVDVSGNQTVATARGNSATNALNATPSANYGTQTTPASSVLNNTAGVSTATASYALLNVQENSGAVNAFSSATYSVTLNSAAGSPASVTGSSASVTGNVIGANAYGNSASNTMTLVALNTGNATAALGNTQVNSGAINASVTGGTNSLLVGPTGANGSTFTVSANSITAHAVGNAAVNVIGVK